MKYRKNRNGEDLSILGYGCMRFSRKGGGIDLDKAQKEILAAVEAGVNYFDTAYIYPGSEAALGEIVERTGIRGKINIATKLPQYLVRSVTAADKYFDEELKRLRTDYVDYYLMHMLTDLAAWEKLKAVGIEEWIAKKKESGQIRQIGFSFHGSTETFLPILDAYDWDFVQVQYNYMDENTQAGRAGVAAAAEKGIPVIIMEPLRGGNLVNLLPHSAKRRIADYNATPDSAADSSPKPEQITAAGLALRWLWNQPEVTVVLSGMNSLAMVEENCCLASGIEPGGVPEKEAALVAGIKEDIQAAMKVPCTGCRYCMPCPQGVDIPGTFRAYNAMGTEGKAAGRHIYFQTVSLRPDPGYPSKCIGCGKCEKHCPQHISIREELKKAEKALRPIHYRIATAVASRFVTPGG